MVISENAHTKSFNETNMMNMSKSGKSTFFHYIFVNIFSCNFFDSFEISIKCCVFLYIV
jgi:hypothetical protein